MRETGVGIYDPLFFIGVVENNVDERLEKRVQVRAFGVHGTVDQIPTEDLPWATLVYGSFDPNSPLPRINQFVFGMFLDGRDAQQPLILGLIPTQMTEVVNPEVTGWGNIPAKDARILAKGSNPEDIGQPISSKLERGENIEETYVLNQELSRIKNIPIAGGGAFEEPAPAYNTEYPFNRVIETSHHSIELDDTPGAERITIFHKSGSYISIDSNGTTVNKSIGDKYEINDTHQHIYVGGKNIVTIEGDSKVLVKGNKIEEIEGDYQQIVHGNHILSVGGQLNLNGSDEVQLRAAKVRIHANVENVNIKAATNVNIQSAADINIKSEGMYITASGALDLRGDHVKAGSGAKVSINAALVAIDDIVHMAMGEAANPAQAGNAEGVDLPEPTAKGTSSTQHRNNSSSGSSGYASQDDGEADADANNEAQNTTNQRLTSADVQEILQGEEPLQARSQAEAFLGRKLSDSEWNNLVAATVAESLPNSPQEQAGIMAVILNRVKSSQYPNTVNEVLLQPNQFQAVTGTRNNPGPVRNFTNPDERQMASTIRGVNQYLGTMSPNWLNFTSNISAAYGPGTDITFRDTVRNSNDSRIIGGTVFGTV
jgi:spore germination cell wall hydrolase CwlJ-like protein